MHASSCPTLCDPMDCSPPGSSVHGTLQARILAWVAIPFCRGSSQLRDQNWVSCIAGRFFTVWATGRKICHHNYCYFCYSITTEIVKLALLGFWALYMCCVPKFSIFRLISFTSLRRFFKRTRILLGNICTYEPFCMCPLIYYTVFKYWPKYL